MLGRPEAVGPRGFASLRPRAAGARSTGWPGAARAAGQPGRSVGGRAPAAGRVLTGGLLGVAATPVRVVVRQPAGDPPVHPEGQDQQPHHEAEDHVGHAEVQDVGALVQDEDVDEPAEQEERADRHVHRRRDVSADHRSGHQHQADDDGDQAQEAVRRQPCHLRAVRVEEAQLVGEAEDAEDQEDDSAEPRSDPVDGREPVVQGSSSLSFIAVSCSWPPVHRRRPSVGSTGESADRPYAAELSAAGPSVIERRMRAIARRA